MAATFERWSGFRYGRATFHPQGSVLAYRGKVAQLGGQYTAFPFCTEAESPVLVKKWKSLDALIHVTPWGQGDMHDHDR